MSHNPVHNRATCPCGKVAMSNHGFCRQCQADADDITEAELEAIIAEQMSKLPAWWHNSHQGSHRHEGVGTRKLPKPKRTKKLEA